MSLEDFMSFQVSSVSRKDEDLALAPSNITVVTAQQIRDWGVRDLKEVLRRVAGYRMVYDRDEWVFSARGVVSDNTTQYNLLFDGRRINHMNGNGAGYMMDVPLDLSNIKQIEIIRGPGSPVWGSGSLGGTINLVSFNGRDFKKPYNATVALGQNATRRLNMQFGKAYGEDFDLMLAGAYYESDGKIVRADSSDTGTSMPNCESVTGFTRSPTCRFATNIGRYEPSMFVQLKARASDFTLNNYLITTLYKNPRQEANGLAGRNTFVNKEVMFSEGSVKKKVFGDGEAKVRISGDIQRYGYLNAGGNSSFNNAYDQAWSLFGDFNKPFGDQFAISVGGDYTYTRLGPFFTSKANFDYTLNPPGAGVAFSWRRTAPDKNLGAYAMLSYKPISSLTLGGGFRVDHNILRAAGTPNAVAPRASAVYQSDQNQVFKLLFNNGFYRPNWSQTLTSNFNVMPERLTQAEFIYLRKFGGGITLTSTVYWQSYKDAILLSPSSANVNAGTYKMYGLELEGFAPIGAHSAYANVALGRSKGSIPRNVHPDDVRVAPDGYELNYPAVTLATGAKIKAMDRLYFNPALRANSPVTYRMTPATLTPEDATYGKIPSIYYVDANLVYGEPNDEMSYSLFVENLFNNRTIEPISIRNGSVEGYGRFVEARVTTRF